MKIELKHNLQLSYKGRNKDIRLAQKVLHIIKSEYDAASPDTVYRLSKKHNRQMSRRNLTNNKLYAFRQVQKSHMDSDIEYVKTILNVFKQARTANCKEYSELAYIIAKLNNFQDCNCINFAILQPDGMFADSPHTVLLINQKVPKNKTRLHKYYIEDIFEASAFRPFKKSIVVDPLFGIVDYWDNAVIKYGNIYPEISAKNLYVGARDLILSNPKDINEIKRLYPELLFNNGKTSPKQNFLKRIFKLIFRINI